MIQTGVNFSCFLFRYSYSTDVNSENLLAGGTERKESLGPKRANSCSSLFSCTLVPRVGLSYRSAVQWPAGWLKLWDKSQFSGQSNQERDPCEAERAEESERRERENKSPNSLYESTRVRGSPLSFARRGETQRTLGEVRYTSIHCQVST